MSDSEFWTKWSAIGQIIGAMGTFLAVLTSLYLSRRSEKPRLHVNAGVRILVGHGSVSPYPEYVSITVRNVGTQTAHVTQFGWRTGFWPVGWSFWLGRQYAIQTPGALGIGEDPPFEVAPGKKRDTMLDKDKFFKGIAEMSGEPFFARRWPSIGMRPTSVYIVAHLESGLSISAPIEREFAKELLSAEMKADKGRRVELVG